MSHVFRAFRPELTETDLPTGVIGQVSGLALVYDVIDSHESTFVRGALDRTIRERVAAGKVKLYWDHGDAPVRDGMYDSDLHVGTVRSLTDVQLEDGRWAAYMVADLFDTPKGREVKQYLQSVLSSGGETGLSIGGYTKGIKSTMVRVNGDLVERITEFALSEISITSMQSVPDSEVLAVRAEAGTDPAAVAEAVVEVLRAKSDAEETVSEMVTVDAEALAASEDVDPPSTFEMQVAAFRALARALPESVVRVETDAVLGDATAEDSDAAGPTPGDSDADGEDSRTTEVPLVYATMDERLRALRSSYRK